MDKTVFGEFVFSSGKYLIDGSISRKYTARYLLMSSGAVLLLEDSQVKDV